MTSTARERFIATALFESVDRPYRMETIGFWKETIERWHGEGLPAEMESEAALYIHNQFDLLAPIDLGSYQHPGLYPLFEEDIIEENETHIVKRDMSGSIVRVHRDGSSSIPQYLDFPVKDRQSWLEVKERLDPSSTERIDQHQFFFQLAKDQQWPLFVFVPGLFGTLRHLLGGESILYAYYDTPDLVHEISQHWVMMWKSILSQVHERHQPDYIELWEDMCGRNGPLISPAMFEEFMSPYYRELVNFARHELNIPVVGVDTDGDMSVLIPKFVDAGVNLLLPFEVQAGMDVLEVRQQWPDQFCIMGGMDKRALAKDRIAIEEEVMRVVPQMVAQGGYIPGIDHSVPPDVSYENWIYYRDLVRDVAAKHCK